MTVEYDCTNCPGYCCSGMWSVDVSPVDVVRLAAHFGQPNETIEQWFLTITADGDRHIRHKPDPVLGKACVFFDTTARRCTIYEARPSVCRGFPFGDRCGLYDFLQWTRMHEGEYTAYPLIDIASKAFESPAYKLGTAQAIS